MIQIVINLRKSIKMKKESQSLQPLLEADKSP